jgi:hypothetical protein
VPETATLQFVLHRYDALPVVRCVPCSSQHLWNSRLLIIESDSSPDLANRESDGRAEDIEQSSTSDRALENESAECYRHQHGEDADHSHAGLQRVASELRDSILGAWTRRRCVGGKNRRNTEQR